MEDIFPYFLVYCMLAKDTAVTGIFRNLNSAIMVIAMIADMVSTW